MQDAYKEIEKAIGDDYITDKDYLLLNRQRDTVGIILFGLIKSLRDKL